MEIEKAIRRTRDHISDRHLRLSTNAILRTQDMCPTIGRKMTTLVRCRMALMRLWAK